MANLFQYDTVLIQQSIHTPCQPRFCLGRHVGGEVIASPHFITPDELIGCAALDHDGHSASIHQVSRALSQFQPQSAEICW